MRFLAAFRAESAAQDRWRAAIRSFAWLLLALFPWLLSLGGNAHEVPKFSEAALAPCLAATILLARWLYEDAGGKRSERRRVGKACVVTFRSGGARGHKKKKN